MDYERRFRVAAPPSAVWSVMADVVRWPEWTASMTRVEPLGEPELAAGHRYRVRQPKLPVAVWEVTELEPGRSFTWVSRSPGLTSTGVHAVTAADGGSDVTLRIEQVGPASLVARLLLPLTRRYVDLEAAGLATRVKSLG